MKELMLGNAAVARGAYEAGVKVVSSYPGTPSTEITENIAKYDEIYSLCEKGHSLLWLSDPALWQVSDFFIFALINDLQTKIKQYINKTII